MPEYLKIPLPGVLYGMKIPWKNKSSAVVAVLILLVGGCLLWALFIEPNRLTLRRVEAQIAGWPRSFDGMKIVALSDLHLRPAWRGAHLERIVRAVNAEAPDLIFFLGDFINGTGGTGSNLSEAELTAFLKQFRAPLGVYAVLGNHEFWYGYTRIRKAVEDAGITVVENRVVPIRCREETIHVCGADDLFTGEVDLERIFSDIPAGENVLFLTHNPQLVDRLEPGCVTVAFAGHTHGGQIRLPWIGSDFLPVSVRPRHEPGLHRTANGILLFLSSGIGTSPLPIRWNCPPEIGVLTIRAAEEPGQNDTGNATK